jgi:hypothetical protein
MLKKALATVAVTGAMLAAGASGAFAAPAADQGDPAAKAPVDTLDICNAPTKDNPDKRDSYTGVLKKGDMINNIVGSLLPGKAIIAGLCDSQDIKKDKGQGGDAGQGQGSDQTTPAPAPAPGGGSGNGNGNQGGGDSPFPVSK